MIPKVSVVIPCYNDARFVEQSIRSAVNQTYSNKEIIVVDDGSNEETKRVLQRSISQIDKLITQANAGVIIARNIGIENANGQYILTLDSDDYFEPTFLEKAVEILLGKRDVGMVTCWLSIRDENDAELRVDKPTGRSAFNTLFYNNAPASLLFRKECWNEVGGYDLNLEKGYEDWEFNVAVGERGWKVFVIEESLFNYRKRKISRNKSAKPYYNQIRKYVYKKHKSLLISNMDETIDFLLSEINMKNETIEELRNSISYRFWSTYIKPITKRLKSKNR